MDNSRIQAILTSALARGDQVNYEAVTQELFSEAYKSDWTGMHLTQFANMFYLWSLRNKEKAIVGANLASFLFTLEIDGVRFRSPFLKSLQEDFMNRKSMKNTNRSKWLIFTLFLCKLFQCVRAGLLPVQVLVSPVYSCLEMLLVDSTVTDEEIKCGVQRLRSVGQLLSECDSDKMDELMSKIRKKIMSNSTPNTGRILLLEMLEIYSGGWKLKHEVKRYYKKKLAEATLES